MKRLAVLSLLAAALCFAHPMGNFSVNHYARLEATARGVQLTYAIDLAEIPTFDLLHSWQLERTSPAEKLDSKAREQARLWLSQLRIQSGTTVVIPKFIDSKLVISDGAGNLPVARITTHAWLDVSPGAVRYEDRNFPDRAGWKEIVIAAGKGAELREASQSSKELSAALTSYPPDPTVAPPQDLRAELTWTASQPIVARNNPTVPKITPIAQPTTAPAATPPATTTPAAAPPGSVVRGDALSRLLRERVITPWMMLMGVGIAFLLGCAHALTPGHGKTIVAAYLVGSRGTLKHAAFLGAMVTFTHTVSVFALGLATLFFFRFVMPEKITQWLGVISGLSIVAIGLWMAYTRWRAARRPHLHHHHHEHGHTHDHTHHHPHDHHHSHDHDHDHAHALDHTHVHDHHHHDHSHAGHSHVPNELSWKALVALGASGGLVPCESALVLLLAAVALRQVGFGLLLLVSFSAGLASVLMAIGAIVLYAKSLLPERKTAGSHAIARYIPVASAAIVTVVGLVMTGVSLGWIRPSWMIG